MTTGMKGKTGTAAVGARGRRAAPAVRLALAVSTMVISLSAAGIASPAEAAGGGRVAPFINVGQIADRIEREVSRLASRARRLLLGLSDYQRRRAFDTWTPTVSDPNGFPLFPERSVEIRTTPCWYLEDAPIYLSNSDEGEDQRLGARVRLSLITTGDRSQSHGAGSGGILPAELQVALVEEYSVGGTWKTYDRQPRRISLRVRGRGRSNLEIGHGSASGYFQARAVFSSNLLPKPIVETLERSAGASSKEEIFKLGGGIFEVPIELGRGTGNYPDSFHFGPNPLRGCDSAFDFEMRTKVASKIVVDRKGRVNGKLYTQLALDAYLSCAVCR